jgi:hypothetical protein
MKVPYGCPHQQLDSLRFIIRTTVRARTHYRYSSVVLLPGMQLDSHCNEQSEHGLGNWIINF